MGYTLNGTDGLLIRQAGNVASSDSMTILWAIKRLSDQPTTTLREVLAVREYSPGNTGHSIFINFNGPDPRISVNYGQGQSGAVPLPVLNSWEWMAMRGTTGNIELGILRPGGWQWAGATQISFNPTIVIFGRDDSPQRALHAKYSHLREWNGALTDPELTAETLSASPVRAGALSGLVQSNSGVGGSLSVALQGEVGSPFQSQGGVTVDLDQPLTGLVVSGEGQLPITSQITAALQLVGTESADVSVLSGDLVSGLTLIGTENPDVATDAAVPNVQIFTPAGPVTADTTIQVRGSATDDIDVTALRIYRDGLLIGSWADGGLQTIAIPLTYLDNGTINFRVEADDAAGNTGLSTADLVVNIAAGQIPVTIQSDKTALNQGGSILFTIGIPPGVTPTQVCLLKDNVKIGLPVPPPYERAVGFFQSTDNGVFEFRASVDTATQSGISDPISITINLPSGNALQPIALGIAEQNVEIPRQETARAIMFDLAQLNGSPLAGVVPTVLISKAGGNFTPPTGQVFDTSLPGRYGYQPSKEDVDTEGDLVITVRHANAQEIAPIEISVVTEYGHR